MGQLDEPPSTTTPRVGSASTRAACHATMTDLIRPVAETHRPSTRPRRPRLSSAFQILVVGTIAYTGAALLNADHLWRTAERQPFGHRRDLYLELTGPVRQASKTLHLDLPGRAVAAVRGERHSAKASISALAGASTTPAVSVPTHTPAAAATDSTTPTRATTRWPQPSIVATTVVEPSPPASATETTTPIIDLRVMNDIPIAPDVSNVAALWAPESQRSVAPAPVALLRTPTPGQPLRLWVGGDSLAVGLGMSLAHLTGDQAIVAPESDARISTGLTRPDYFDWPGELAGVLSNHHPDVVVVMFGANDAQPIAVGNRSYSIDAPEWQAEYRRRVDEVIALAEQSGVRLVWVGQPAMRSGDLDRKMAILDSIYADEAALHPVARYIDTRSIFGAHYDAYVTGADGVSVRMRTDDGVHFTNAGYDRLGRSVLDEVREETAVPGSAPTMPSVPA